MLPIYPFETNPLDELSLHEQKIEAFENKLRDVQKTVSSEGDQLHNESFHKVTNDFNALKPDALATLQSALIDEKKDESLHDQDRADSLIQRADNAVFHWRSAGEILTFV